MLSYVLFEMPDGNRLVAEVDGLEGLEVPAAAEEEMSLAGMRRAVRVPLTRESVQNSLDSLIESIATILQRLATMRSDELTVEIGVKLSAEVGMAIAKTASEGHLQVTMKWAGQLATGQSASANAPED